MTCKQTLASAITALITGLWLAGCGSPAGNSPSPGTAGSPAAVDTHDDHDHAHPSEGPHHGDLVELGNEEYHAEVVHADDGTVTVYILDSSAKSAVPIDAPELTINVTHEGQPEQFKLAASPDAGDPPGRSSRFTLTDKEFVEHLDAEGPPAKLAVTIDGKSYTGQIEHHHGHEHGEGHKH